jgi:hypothetical protein
VLRTIASIHNSIVGVRLNELVVFLVVLDKRQCQDLLYLKRIVQNSSSACIQILQYPPLTSSFSDLPFTHTYTTITSNVTKTFKHTSRRKQSTTETFSSGTTTLFQNLRMKMFTSIAVGVFGLATLGQAHMKMTTPTPYAVPSIDNSPLNADGSNFPCKQASGASYSAAATNTMPIGSVQTLSFIGSAVHGGGSCQVSVTYDAQPNAKSTFKVIHSIIGGCPMKNITGNNGDDATQVDPDQYPFTIPSSLPTGSATLAWTWFNKVGNREMYMNCAPIAITAASTKRSDEEELMARNVTQLMERDQAAFNALPDMFTANIGNGCGTVSSTDLIFPDPGESVESLGLQTSSALAAPTGNCAAAVAATVAASQATTAPAVASTASTVATTASPVATTAPAVSGGVFQTVPTTAPAAGTTTAPIVSVQVASTAAASGATPSATSAAPAASTGTTGSGTAVTAGTACTSEGMFNCVGGTSYQQCASGTWSVVMPLAAGTSCTPGQSMDMTIAKLKRSIRFSEAHIRRQLQSS